MVGSIFIDSSIFPHQFCVSSTMYLFSGIFPLSTIKNCLFWSLRHWCCKLCYIHIRHYIHRGRACPGRVQSDQKENLITLLRYISNYFCVLHCRAIQAFCFEFLIHVCSFFFQSDFTKGNHHILEFLIHHIRRLRRFRVVACEFSELFIV